MNKVTIDKDFTFLLDKVRQFPKQRMAVVHPVDDLSLEGAIAAAEQGVMIPVLIGPRSKIEQAAKNIDADISTYELIDTPHSHASAATAVTLAREGKVAALMKGAIASDELLSAVIDSQTGLRTERRSSHVYVFSADA